MPAWFGPRGPIFMCPPNMVGVGGHGRARRFGTLCHAHPPPDTTLCAQHTGHTQAAQASLANGY